MASHQGNEGCFEATGGLTQSHCGEAGFPAHTAFEDFADLILPEILTAPAGIITDFVSDHRDVSPSDHAGDGALDGYSLTNVTSRADEALETNMTTNSIFSQANKATTKTFSDETEEVPGSILSPMAYDASSLTGTSFQELNQPHSPRGLRMQLPLPS